MGLREEIIETLRSGYAARINFSFIGITGAPFRVDGTTFTRVASAIENGSISIDSHVPSNLGGSYSPYPVGGGVLHARPIRNSRLNKAFIIHEAVHASVDLTRSVVAVVDEEAAGYMAQLLYMRFTHFPNGQLSLPPASQRIIESAARAASSIDRTGQASETNIAQLRQRIGAHPNYSYVFTEGCFVEGRECYLEVRRYNG